MTFHPVIRILLRAFQSALVIVIMVFTAVIAIIVGLGTKLHGPLYRSGMSSTADGILSNEPIY